MSNPKTQKAMKNFNFKTCLEWYAEEAVASLYWTKRERVYVNGLDQELDWFEDKTGTWKDLWKIIGYYPYTTRTFVNYDKETSEFNFSVGGINDDETSGLARLLWEVWFGYIEKKYHKADNKTALKIQNRLNGKVIYLGWYDGRFTVTELEAEPDLDFRSEMVPLEED